MDAAIALSLIAMGLAISGVWTRDIISSKHVDRSRGLARARDRETGAPFLPHWIAECATAAGLVVAGIGLLGDARWSGKVAGVASGALFYTSMNSLGWALARPERRGYAAPMIVGVAVAVGAIVHVLTMP